MIKINLIPEKVVSGESQLRDLGKSLKVQARIFRTLAIVVVIIVLIVQAFVLIKTADNRKKRDILSRKLAELAPGIKECDALMKVIDDASSKEKMIDNLVKNRFSWAKKLNELSDSTAQGIWFSSIAYDKGHMVINGYASSVGEQGTSLVGKFIDGLKGNKSFSSDFSDIKLETIKSGKYADQEVMVFTITCVFNRALQ